MTPLRKLADVAEHAGFLDERLALVQPESEGN